MTGGENQTPMEITLYPKYLFRSLFVHGRHDFFKEGYKLLYPEYSRHGMTPWQHYVIFGKRQGLSDGRSPSGYAFFPEGYAIEYPDVIAAGEDPWRHYALYGRKEGRDSGFHPKKGQFFPEGYLAMYPDVAKARMDPWRHYALYGRKEGRDNGFHPSGKVFFAAGYLAMYPDVAKARMDPWRHYALYGRKEGRDSGFHPKKGQFFPEGYLAMYPDVAKARMDPWRHYALYGRKEGRDNGLHPDINLFSPEDYLAMYPDGAAGGTDPWHDYVLSGKNARRYPTAAAMKQGKSKVMPYSLTGLEPDISEEFSDSLGRFDLHTLVEILKLKAAGRSDPGAAREENDACRSQKLLDLFCGDYKGKVLLFCGIDSMKAGHRGEPIVREFIGRRYLVLTVAYDPASSGFVLCCDSDRRSCRFDSADLRLLPRLGLDGLERIFISSLNICPGNTDALDSAAGLIISLKMQTGAELVYTGQEFSENCSENPDGQPAYDIDIERNRPVYIRLLQACDKYTFASGKAFSRLAGICSLDPEKVVPYEFQPERNQAGRWAYRSDGAFARFTVLVCGTSESEYAFKYVKGLASLLMETHPDIRIVFLGECADNDLPENIDVTGAYDSARMPELMRIFEPNCALVPFISGEAGRCVQDIVQFGMPVITFDTGFALLSAYGQTVRVSDVSPEGLRKAVSELYDVSYPYKLKNHTEQYSVTAGELHFISEHEGLAGKDCVRTGVTICINVADESEDYESILDYLKSLPAADDAVCKKQSKRLLDSESISICFLVNERLVDSFRQTETIRQFRGRRYQIIPTNGCGAFKLLRDPAAAGNVIYIGAFSKNVSSLEKYYILTSLFGKSGERIEEIGRLIGAQDVLLYLDNFYRITSRSLAARLQQNEEYLKARRAYLTHGSFELYLDHSDSGICAFRNAFAFNISLLKKVSGLILDRRFFVSCQDQVVFDLALNDLTLRAAYKYIKLIPGPVAEHHLSSQREFFYEMAEANFNVGFYLDKYSEIKDKNVSDPLGHFRKHGFDENRLYADFISDEWLERHYGSADDAEKYYLKSYLSYAEARFIYGMSLADYKNYVGLPGHYLADPAEYYKATVDFSRIKLSFIVPVYNSAKFLRHCLDSIYNVDYPNFEVILVDDGSKDSSVEIINEYKSRYSDKTKVIIHPENLCFAATHKDGINAAEGKYFTIIDADDYISEDYAKVFAKFAEVYHLDMAVCDWTRPKTFREFNCRNDYLIEPVVATAGELQDSFGNWNNPLIPNIHYGLNRKIYNRESFIRANPITIDPEYAYNEDFSVTLKLSDNYGFKIGLIRNRLYGWFDNPDSVSYCDMTEIAIVHFVYVFFDDLEKFIQNKKFSDRLISCFQKHLYGKLGSIANTGVLKNRLEFLACQLDQHIDLINGLEYRFKNYIKGSFNNLYLKAIEPLLSRRNKVCVLDTVGHQELKDFLLPKLSQDKVDFYYTVTSQNETFAVLMDKLKQVNECSIIVTDGDWAMSAMATDLPIINTWHGMGALKYVYQFTPKQQPVIGFSSGKDVNFCYRWMYNLPDSRIITNGNLVASRYLHADFREKCRNQFFSKYPNLNGKRVYLYTPTFRGYEPNYSIMEPGYKWDRISELLLEDEVLLVKWHPCLKNFNSDVLPDLSKYSNIIDVTDSDLSEVLLSASVLLTDYSSCIFYAALINLPIGILATDLDSYSSNRGFFIDYRSEAPCEVFEGTDERKLLEYIRSRRSDTDEYQKFRNRHVGGVTDNVDEILTALVKKYLNGNLNLY